MKLFIAGLFLALILGINGAAAASANQNRIEVNAIPSIVYGSVRFEGRTAGRTRILIRRNGNKEFHLLTRGAGSFNRNIFLTRGTGSYEISLLIETGRPFQYSVVRNFTVINRVAVNRFLAPGEGIESDHPKIIRVAREITRRATTDRQRIRAVYDWVRTRINYDHKKKDRILANPHYDGPSGALYALKERRGVCEEFANLSAALLRAIGIQTKVITGYVADSSSYHAWNAAFDNQKKRWIVFDATFASNGGNFFDMKKPF